MAQGGSAPVAVTREKFVATPPGKLTKSRGNSTASGRIESAKGLIRIQRTRRIEWYTARGSGTAVAVTWKKSVATTPRELT